MPVSPYCGVTRAVPSRNAAFGQASVLSHLSLIWFTVWSSVAHGGIMAVQAIVDPAERGHFSGDVAGLLLIAIVLGLLTPRGVTTRTGDG